MSAFGGFDRPAQNYSKLPHKFIEQLPVFETMAEMKVVIYLLRHTWGFSEFGKPKKITTDEFMNGRKLKNGKRMDNGTGLSNNSVIDGLERAVSHGFVVVEVDDRDKARIEKYYCLNMSDMQTLHIDPQELEVDPQEVHSGYGEPAQRTEKETKEINEGKNTKDSCIEILQRYASSIFDFQVWHKLKQRLEKDDVAIIGDEKTMTIAGLSAKVGQFTEAEVYQDKYAPSFAKFGLLIRFSEAMPLQVEV
jgi:DNA-binding PadR family transcriptional regulator